MTAHHVTAQTSNEPDGKGLVPFRKGWKGGGFRWGIGYPVGSPPAFYVEEHEIDDFEMCGYTYQITSASGIRVPVYFDTRVSAESAATKMMAAIDTDWQSVTQLSSHAQKIADEIISAEGGHRL